MPVCERVEGDQLALTVPHVVRGETDHAILIDAHECRQAGGVVYAAAADDRGRSPRPVQLPFEPGPLVGDRRPYTWLVGGPCHGELRG
jgi:hypothetical protein